MNTGLELWKTITDYPNYDISNLVQGLHNGFGRYLSPTLIPLGFRIVAVYNREAGTQCRFRVATYWVPNLDGIKRWIHRNGDKEDNRAENIQWVKVKLVLRTRKAICWVMAKRKNCSSAYKRVTWSNKKPKRVSHIRADDHLYYLGNYYSEEQAHQAYLDAKAVHHVAV
ncbi:hypothetical protein [Hymenobacter volaticus]|uniref:HNH endonuclease n=1 Tax=Hymenobacter volaticus TaxID=2932254 RepID=A0ABY4G2Q5_9BACT|nr:hypothetical protein [Hymenobacter volaticus]UOQ64854.1 hypothetical protein MUN86_14925 [Hymenobacter volaticus]